MTRTTTRHFSCHHDASVSAVVFADTRANPTLMCFHLRSWQLSLDGTNSSSSDRKHNINVRSSSGKTTGNTGMSTFAREAMVSVAGTLTSTHPSAMNETAVMGVWSVHSHIAHAHGGPISQSTASARRTRGRSRGRGRPAKLWRRRFRRRILPNVRHPLTQHRRHHKSKGSKT